MDEDVCDCNVTAAEAPNSKISRCECGAVRYALCALCGAMERLGATTDWSGASCVQCSGALCWPCAQRMKRSTTDPARIVCHHCDASSSDHHFWCIVIKKMTTSPYCDTVETEERLHPHSYATRDDAANAVHACLPPNFDRFLMLTQMRERYDGWFGPAIRESTTQTETIAVLLQGVHAPSVGPLSDPRTKD